MSVVSNFLEDTCGVNICDNRFFTLFLLVLSKDKFVSFPVFINFGELSKTLLAFKV
jgi:hypothetical protein